LFRGLDWRALARGELAPPFVPLAGRRAVSPHDAHSALEAYALATHGQAAHGSGALLPEHAAAAASAVTTAAAAVAAAAAAAVAVTEAAVAAEGSERSGGSSGGGGERNEPWSLYLPVVPRPPELAANLLMGILPQPPFQAARTH
jgi:hypothetical protein